MSDSPTTAAAPREKGFLDWLQCLRGVSVLVVLLYHMADIAQLHFDTRVYFDWFQFGHCGVHIFFVISGFIMYYLHWKYFGNRSRFLWFVKKRAMRIYPVYWVATTLVLAGALLVPAAISTYKFSAGYLVESYSLIRLGFIDRLPVIPAAWSLFHEIKFYLIFSLFMLLPRKVSWWVLGVWVAASIARTAWLVFHGVGFWPSWSWFWLSPFNLQFVAGWGAAALLMNRRPGRNETLLALLIGIALLGWTAVTDNLGRLERTEHVLYYGAASFFLVYGAAAVDGVAAWRSRAPHFLHFTGDASYSVYLLHYPVFVLVVKVLQRWPGVSAEYTGLALAAMLVAGWVIPSVFFMLVERPLINIGKRL